MPEYIDREAALAACRSAGIAAIWACRQINALPSADVKPVVRGKWITKNWGFEYSECSVCGYEHRYAGTFNYCPSCGSKMDGGQDE